MSVSARTSSCATDRRQTFISSSCPATHFKTKELSKQINSSRLSFAEEEYMVRFLDVYPGSATVLGLMNDKDHHVKTVIDEDVFKEEMFGCHPCVNTSSIRFRTKELTEKIFPALHIAPAIVRLKGE
ncbi:MAG: hypothetical protein IJM63_10605 [Solobacterium sp.]|nr:hypothetical protein [Solobacterium sp.]